ncbi:unnamed protein product [Alopecurus aequalis]
MSLASPDPAASRPSPREEEGSARKRIAYSREFLISAGTSCTRLPVGFDASKLSELSQVVETGSRAPLGRWRDACWSSGSGNTESKSNQLDRHPGDQWRSVQSKEHDGLLGSGPSPGIPCYAGPLTSNSQLTRRNTGGYQPTLQYQASPVSHKNVDLITTETSGSFEDLNKDRVEEERQRRASFELIRKKQYHNLQEKNKAHESDKENLGDGIISLLHDSAGKRYPPTRSDKQGGLNVSSLSQEDAIKTVPLLPTPRTCPLKPIGFTNGFSQKRLQIESFNTSQNSEIQPLNTEDIMESSICSQLFSGEGIIGSGNAYTLSPKQMVAFKHSKCGPYHMRPSDNPTFSGSSQEGANSHEERMEFNLPEEDALFSVNDFLCTPNTDNWLAAEWSRAEGLRPEDKVADINSRFQSLDVSGSHFHDQIGQNNLYHIFETRPNAEFPMRNPGAMLPPSRPSDRNRQAPFDMPKAIQHGAYCQDLKSMQGVRPAPGGPAAPHHILSHMTMPGSSLPPQGFPRCAPHMFYHRTEMAGANSFQMHRCQPGYGETGMVMTGPGLEGYHAGPFDRPLQAEPSGRSRQMHPELAGPVHGFHRHFRR